MRFRLVEDKTITVSDRDFSDIKNYLARRDIKYKEVENPYSRRYYNTKQQEDTDVGSQIDWLSKSMNISRRWLKAFQSKHSESLDTLYKLCYRNIMSLELGKNILKSKIIKNEPDSDLAYRLKTIAFVNREDSWKQWVDSSDEEAIQRFSELKDKILEMPTTQIEDTLKWLEARHFENSGQPQPSLEREELEKEYELFKSGDNKVKNKSNTTYFNIRKKIENKDDAWEAYTKVLDEREKSRINKKRAKERATADVQTRERLAKKTEGEYGKSILSKVLNNGKEKKTLNRQDVYNYVKKLMKTDSSKQASDAVAKMIDDGQFDDELDNILSMRYNSAIGNKLSDKLNANIIKTLNSAIDKIAKQDN